MGQSLSEGRKGGEKHKHHRGKCQPKGLVWTKMKGSHKRGTHSSKSSSKEECEGKRITWKGGGLTCGRI